jgi:RHS repeat-associated protein
LLDGSGARYVVEDGMILTYPVPEPNLPLLPVEGPGWPMTWDGTAEGEIFVHRPETGQTLTFRPLPQGSPDELLLVAVKDRNDNTITISYTADGTPAEMVHHSGYRIGVTCEGGQITVLSLQSAPDRPVLLRYGYDTQGNLAEVINSSGLPLRYFYDDHRRMTGWEDRNGVWYRFEYDDGGRCTAGRGRDGFLDYTFTYDDAAHRTTAVDSLGFTTTYQFNDAFQLVAETDALGHVVRQEWNRRDQLVSRTDPLGRTTRMEWDAAGNLTAVHLPDGSTSAARFNELNLPVEVTGYDGAVTRQEWDERGNCTAVTKPDGATVTFTRDETGALTSLTDPLGEVQHFTNNAAGQPVSATDPLGAVWQFTYDAFGRSATVTDPLGATTVTTWTIEGHQASRRDPDGTSESWAYDGEGNCVAHTDALGQVTRFTYGAFDLLTSRTTPDGVRYVFTHDTELRLTQVGNPRGLTWDYTYDAVGRLVAETDFEGRTLNYTYDAAGQPLGRTNPLGQTTAFRYDSVGNQVEKTVDGSATTVFSHDATGRLLSATGHDAALTYEYDAAGRITSEAIDGRAVTTTYDALDRPLRRTTPSGVTTRYTYDAAGNRTTLTSSGRTLVSAYDAMGRETARRLGATGLVLAHTWDTEDRLTSQTLAIPHSARPLKQRAYTYRADGCVTALDDRFAGRRSFDVDAVGQITAVRAADWTESYAYDETGNQTWASWPDRHSVPEGRGERAYEGHRVSRAGSVHYEYDAAGRVTMRRKTRLSRKPDVWRYTWDAEDRLTSVTTPDGTVWRYRYDPLGRRVAKQRLAVDGATILEETRFVWDGPHLVEQTERAAGGPEEHSLTWDRDGVQPVVQTERVALADAPQEVVDERFFAIVTDLVGTPTELVSEDGTIAWSSDTTIWGLGVPGTKATAYTPLRFPGQYFDAETGLHYNYFRHYDPVTAAYVSPDPLGMDAGPNPRRYSLNPLLWIDYLGLLTCRQNARRLKRNMKREGRKVPRGHAAAHIVPSGGNLGHWAPGARSRALLERYGVDVNDAANGIPLGHPSPHNFTHREPFLRRVNEHLEQVVRDGVDQGMGARAIRTQLRSELRGIGRQVEGELATGVPGPGAVWTAP